MKKNSYGMAILIAVGMVSSAQGADSNITITGEVFIPTCNLSTESKNMTVPLGSVQRSELSTAGVTTKGVTFTLNFTDCALNTGVQVKFMGTAAASDETAFALDNPDGVSTAKNVGLQIRNVLGNVQYPNSIRSWQTAMSRDFDRTYKANYIALSDNVTPGDANVVVEYLVTYV